MQPILDELLTRWQEAPETAPEEICRQHPELLAELLDRVAIIQQIERLAGGDDAVPFLPYVPPLPSGKPERGR